MFLSAWKSKPAAINYASTAITLMPVCIWLSFLKNRIEPMS